MAHVTNLGNTVKLDRRAVLKGIAGATLALPLLDCMRPRRATAAGESAPRRSVFIYLPNGVNTLDFQILESGENYTFSKILKPLEKHRANITPISGLYHPGGLGTQHYCSNIWLTGGKLGPSDRNTISVDQLMARVTAPQTRYSSMQLSNRGGSISVNTDGVRLPAHSTPRGMFGELFEEPKGGIEAQRRRLHRKGSILDAVLDEARDLDRQLGREDRGRLEQYLTSVREVEIRAERADRWLDVPRPKIENSDKARVNRDVSQQEVGEYFRTMYDLIVLAFQTDMTRVATFSTGEEGKGLSIPEIGINRDRHSLSHHNGNPGMMAQLTKSDTFNIEQYSYFLDRLAETKDLDGRPLLDSTMALYGSGMAFGHSHGNANLPLVLAGGKGFGLKHGRHVDYNKKAREFAGYDLANPGSHYYVCHNPVNEKAHMSNLLLTMAQNMGVDVERFGDSTGTIAEVQV